MAGNYIQRRDPGDEHPECEAQDMSIFVCVTGLNVIGVPGFDNDKALLIPLSGSELVASTPEELREAASMGVLITGIGKTTRCG